MQVKIDNFGRVIVPRAIRRQLQLGPGSLLEIEVRGKEVVLGSTPDGLALTEKDGLLVFEGRPTGDL